MGRIDRHHRPSHHTAAAMFAARLAGATLMVAATTADDAIWLVPYTSPSLPTCTRIIHASLFVFTLEFLACCCVIVSSGLHWAVDANYNDGNTWDVQLVLSSIGAGICWAIALGLYIKKWLKRRRRAAARVELQRRTTQQAGNTYGSISEHSEEGNNARNEEEEDPEQSDGVSSEPSPWAVISFTTLGALDEVIYFPSLLLAKMFTPLELCLGTFFAANIILIVVTLFLSQCNPLLQWLDRIPLYGIVSAFAVVLTIGVIMDIISGDS